LYHDFRDPLTLKIRMGGASMMRVFNATCSECTMKLQKLLDTFLISIRALHTAYY